MHVTILYLNASFDGLYRNCFIQHVHIW